MNPVTPVAPAAADQSGSVSLGVVRRLRQEMAAQTDRAQQGRPSLPPPPPQRAPQLAQQVKRAAQTADHIVDLNV